MKRLEQYGTTDNEEKARSIEQESVRQIRFEDAKTGTSREKREI